MLQARCDHIHAAVLPVGVAAHWVARLDDLGIKGLIQESFRCGSEGGKSTLVNILIFGPVPGLLVWLLWQT